MQQAFAIYVPGQKQDTICGSNAFLRKQRAVDSAEIRNFLTFSYYNCQHVGEM